MAETFRKSKVDKLLNKLELRMKLTKDHHQRYQDKNFKELVEYYEGQMIALDDVYNDIKEVFDLQEAR